MVAPGCLDMVNFQAPETVPARFAGRRFLPAQSASHPHAHHAGRVRAARRDPRRKGEPLARPRERASARLARPSASSRAPGQPFHDPEADRALFEAIRGKRAARHPRCSRWMPRSNAPEFSAVAARELRRNLALTPRVSRLPPRST